MKFWFITFHRLGHTRSGSAFFANLVLKEHPTVWLARHKYPLKSAVDEATYTLVFYTEITEEDFARLDGIL